MAFLYSKTIGFFIILFVLISVVKVRSQDFRKEYPKVGDTLPFFMLNVMHYYSKKQSSSLDFKGQPLILDFFSAGCKACFLSFPHLDSLKKEFEGRVQFILIGKKSPGLETQYESYMKHYNLNLPVDYDDSALWNQFGVLLVPYTVWVDSNGIIRQITSPYALTTEHINQFLQGKPQSLVTMENKQDQENEDHGNMFYDFRKPFLIGGNGGADSSYLYRSILCKWDYRTVSHGDIYISSKNKNCLEEIGVTINDLFILAYGDTMPFIMPYVQRDIDKLPNHFGQWATRPINESSRSDIFKYDVNTGTNLYSYSLTLPESENSGLHLQRMMRRDLKNYFSLEAKVEMRKLPCWKIVALKNAEKILRTKGDTPEWKSTFNGVTFQNQPVNSLLVEIWSYFQHEPVFIDETGIDYNIDLKINAVMADMNDIRKELRKNGLDLEKGEKQMKVIVISDALD